MDGGQLAGKRSTKTGRVWGLWFEQTAAAGLPARFGVKSMEIIIRMNIIILKRIPSLLCYTSKFRYNLKIAAKYGNNFQHLGELQI